MRGRTLNVAPGVDERPHPFEAISIRVVNFHRIPEHAHGVWTFAEALRSAPRTARGGINARAPCSILDRRFQSDGHMRSPPSKETNRFGWPAVGLPRH